MDEALFLSEAANGFGLSLVIWFEPNPPLLDLSLCAEYSGPGRRRTHPMFFFLRLGLGKAPCFRVRVAFHGIRFFLPGRRSRFLLLVTPSDSLTYRQDEHY